MRRTVLPRWAACLSQAVVLLGCAGCSTLADSGGGSDNLPNANAGPFREIDNEELGQGRAAPYAFRDDERFQRDAAYLDVDGDPATSETWGYVAHTVFAEDAEPDANIPPNEIVRHVALDGRSFARQFDVVLTPVADWEVDTIGRPAVVRRDGQILLYYAARGGIGVAVSEDGLTFSRPNDLPVITTGTSPAVLLLPDGRVRMYYALLTGSELRVVESIDGLSWDETAARTTLTPRDGELDAAGVHAPFPFLSASSEGRPIEFLYYAATSDADEHSIAMVARYGVDGPWSYATAPVFGSTGSLEPTEPAVMPFLGYNLLFVTQKAGSTVALDYPAIAIGVAPANVVLSPPNPP